MKRPISLLAAVLLVVGLSGASPAYADPDSPTGGATTTTPSATLTAPNTAGWRYLDSRQRPEQVGPQQTLDDIVAEMRQTRPELADRLASASTRNVAPVAPVAPPPAPPQAASPGAAFVNDGGDYNYYDLDSCRREYGEDGGLKYKNHFASCLVAHGTLVFADCQPGGGCLPPKGYLDYRFTQIGFGARGTQNVMFKAAYDEWRPRGSVDWWRTYTVRFTCTNIKDDDDCANTHPEPQTKTLAEWRVNGSLPDLTLDTSKSVGGGDFIHLDVDKVNYHELHTFSWVEGNRFSEYATNQFRCDAAPYASKGGCIFQKAEPVHHVSLRGEDGTAEEAAHVLRAQKDPANTKPGGDGIKIPGGRDSGKPLTRLYSGYEPDYYNANHDIAVKNCRQYWGRDYTNGPNGEKLECDEYPFRSTFEGAEFTDVFPNSYWKYSSEPINWEHNNKAGRLLGDWYASDHNIHGDQFWVEVTGCDGCGGSGGPRPPWNNPPRVDAGPDATSTEGAAATLHGSATDDWTTPTVSWSYRPDANVDAGATCQFGDPHAAVTTFTCNDDGTFVVTLTADDGVNAPVSDTARVNVSNVAPAIRINGPAPWTKYRAGTPVTLSAPFTDPGTNDTHRCAITWDDASSDDVAATNNTCQRTHVFTRPGMYTIRVAVTDDDGGRAQADVMVVVYDPTIGFVTALGSLNSPPGALATSPDKAGRLHFALLGKYLFTNDTTPAGTVDVTLPAANFRLCATALDWLVITPEGKVAIKGTGTVAGKDGYGFVVYATADRLRLVTWKLTDGPNPPANPLYDNRRGAGYDLDDAQPQPASGIISIIYTGWLPGLPRPDLLKPGLPLLPQVLPPSA